MGSHWAFLKWWLCPHRERKFGGISSQPGSTLKSPFVRFIETTFLFSVGYLKQVCKWLFCFSHRGVQASLCQGHGSVSTYSQHSTGKGPSGRDTGQEVLESILVPRPKPRPSPCLWTSTTPLSALSGLRTVRIQGPVQTPGRERLGKYGDKRVPPPALAPELQWWGHQGSLPWSHKARVISLLWSAAGSGDTFPIPWNHLPRAPLPCGI